MEQISTRAVYANNWLTVREDEVRFPDGTPGIYGVIDKRDFALVIPREPGGFWMVEQFRYPIGRRALEFPQGSWPSGKSGSQDDLARAELREFRARIASGEIADSATLAAYSLLTLAESGNGTGR